MTVRAEGRRGLGRGVTGSAAGRGRAPGVIEVERAPSERVTVEGARRGGGRTPEE